ncbi:MAG: hypothetical protein ACRDZU_06980 [Acidimicrobiales bacterium]
MPQAPNATVRFRRRLLGYDRQAVDAALSSAADQLQRAETRRDELIETTANVERIGAQVADMLRSLADRAVELEVEAAAEAAQKVQAAELEAAQIRAQATAVLAEAQATAQQMVESSRQQQAVISERRETALISLQIAIDQMGRLATTIDQIDLTAADVAPSVTVDDQPPPETVVLLPWTASAKPSEPAKEPPLIPAEDPIGPVLARLDDWASSTS